MAQSNSNFQITGKKAAFSGTCNSVLVVSGSIAGKTASIEVACHQPLAEPLRSIVKLYELMPWLKEERVCQEFCVSK